MPLLPSCKKKAQKKKVKALKRVSKNNENKFIGFFSFSLEGVGRFLDDLFAIEGPEHDEENYIHKTHYRLAFAFTHV
jgi:hypothetical protein